ATIDSLEPSYPKPLAGVSCTAQRARPVAGSRAKSDAVHLLSPARWNGLSGAGPPVPWKTRLSSGSQLSQPQVAPPPRRQESAPHEETPRSGAVGAAGLEAASS